MKLAMMPAGKIQISAVACLAAIFAVVALAIPARAADPIFPLGSRIGLVPPGAMVRSTNFEGFEDPQKNAMILLATFPADAFAPLDKSMVPESLQKQGITIEKREPITVNANTGFLLSGTQTTGQGHFRKWMLVAPAGNLTALVTVQFPEQDSVYNDKSVRDALATLAVREVPDAERLSMVPFTVGDLAGFRIDDVLPGRALMLVDAAADKGSSENGSTDKNPDAYKHDANARFLIAAVTGGPNEAKDRDDFARATFGQIGGISNVQIQDAEPLRMNGQAGYETLANATDPEGGGDLKVVQWLRFGSGGYMQMVGVARAALWPDMFTRMRTVRDSIDFK